MRQRKHQELSPELKDQLKEALRERFPLGWGRGKTLDEIVAQTSSAALDLAASLTEDELVEPLDSGPAPVCPNSECRRGKKGAAHARSRSVQSLS